jgi:hypothetical protein
LWQISDFPNHRNALVTSSSRSGMKRNAETAANAQEGDEPAGDPTTAAVHNADKGDSDINEDMVIDVDEPMDDGDNTSKDYAYIFSALSRNPANI